MRRWFTAASFSLAMLAGWAHADLDLSDFDDDAMHAMDDAMKDLEPVLGAGNADAARGDARIIRDGLQWTESYFQKKGGTDDAVDIGKQGEASADQVLAAVDRHDFQAAIVATRALEKNCHTCHDKYKPLK